MHRSFQCADANLTFAVAAVSLSLNRTHQPASTTGSTAHKSVCSVYVTALVAHVPQLQASIAALGRQQQQQLDDNASIGSDSSMTVFEDSGLGLSVLIKRTRKLQGVTTAAAHAAIAALAGGDWAVRRNAKIRNVATINGLNTERKSSVYDGSSSSSRNSAVQLVVPQLLPDTLTALLW
jgi:hypothetical protein